MTFLFDALDPDADPLELTFELSTDGGLTFALATSSGGGTVTANPATGVPPSPALTFRWDSQADSVGLGAPTAVTFRVSADDGLLVDSDTTVLDVDNSPLPPPSCTQVTPPPAAPARG